MHPNNGEDHGGGQAGLLVPGDPRSADLYYGDILSDPIINSMYPLPQQMFAMPNDGTPRGPTPGNSSSPSVPTPSAASQPAAAHAQPRSSVSRALVPNPSSNGPSSFTPITTAASPLGASPTGAGPTSSNYVVPPRPKPGRKPATDEPASKRKAQNRESQRAFRARKAAKITEMQTAADVTMRRHRWELNEQIAETHRLSNENQALRAQLDEARKATERIRKEREYWRDRTTQSETQLNMLHTQLREQNYPLNTFGDQQPVFFPQPTSPTRTPARSPMGSFSGYGSPKSMHLGCGNCKANGECACIDEFAAQPNPFTSPAPFINRPSEAPASPMKPVQFQNIDPFAEREIDFTSQFTKRSKVEQQISLLAPNGELDPKCGFCTDDSNCLCRDQSLQQLPQEPMLPASNASKATGPGSCDACQINPKQRAWCQRVAQLRNDESMPTPTSRNSSIGSALDTLEPHIPDASTPYGNKPSIGCSDAFKLFDGRVPMDSDKLDWVGRLRTVPARRDTITQHPRNYSAVELDTAGIIATLSSTMQPIQPRQEDGENIDIVRIAQRVQRTTQSPHNSLGYAA